MLYVNGTLRGHRRSGLGPALLYEFPGELHRGGSKLKEVERPSEPRGCDSIKRKVCGEGLYTHFLLVTIGFAGFRTFAVKLYGKTRK